MSRSEAWPRVSVADVCSSIVDCVNKTAPVVDGPTPYKMIRTTNVRDGWVNLEEVRYVDEPTYTKWTRRQQPRRGDVILTREAPLGEVGLLRSDDAVFLGQRLVAYRADPTKLDGRFLLYSMLADDMQGQIRSMGSGATVEHMRVPDCEKLTLQLPSLPVQRRIASILSAYDDLIENNTRRIAILEDMARRIYEEWFVRFRFPGHENVRMVESDLGLVPVGWRFGSFGEVANKLSKRFDKHHADLPLIDLARIPRRSNAISEFGAADEISTSRVVFERHTILFGAIRPNFHKVLLAPVNGVTNVSVHTLRPAPGFGVAHLFCLAFADTTVAWAVQHAGGMKMPTINWDVLAKMPAPIPDDQTRNRFEQSVIPMLDAMGVLVRKNMNLRTTRDLLLPKLISGELDVSNLPEPQAAAA